MQLRGGPGPNLLPQNSLPSGGPPMPGGGAQVAVAGATPLMVNQGIAIAPPEVYTANKPRSTPGPKKGAKGGKGAGKGFSAKMKEFVRNTFNNKCVFCGKDTVRSQNPDPDRSNIDHAIPRSRGGNNTAENAQNTCQSCNLSKGDMTTVEFLNKDS